MSNLSVYHLKDHAVDVLSESSLTNLSHKFLVIFSISCTVCGKVHFYAQECCSIILPPFVEKVIYRIAFAPLLKITCLYLCVTLSESVVTLEK